LANATPAGPSFSQLHAHKAEISIRQKTVAMIDGRSVEGKDFNLSLTSRQVRLISNLSSDNRH
jgi:hypothetical protein